MNDDVSWIACAVAGCGYSPFPMQTSFEKRARRTHEWFYCPAGHSLSFKGKSDHEREVDRLNGEIGHYRKLWREALATSRICPWPTCRVYVYASRDSMYDHMRRQHGMPTTALVEEAS